MQAGVEGVSTRKVDDLVAVLSVDSGISKSEVSRICAQLDAEVAAWKPGRWTRSPSLEIFWTRPTARPGQQPGRVTGGRHRHRHRRQRRRPSEVLGCAVGDSETEAFWTEFLRDLRDRGLHGVRLVISDSHRGLVNAVQALPGASWQRSSADMAA